MKRSKWLVIPLVLVSAIMTYRVVSFLISLAFIGFQHLPLRLIATIHQRDIILVPMISLCAAVLVSRWLENFLQTKSIKTNVILLTAIFIVAFFPIKAQVVARPVMCSPIQIAIGNDCSMETLELLVDRYPELINGRDVDWDHYCPLAFAAYDNKTNVIELLVRKGADVDYAVERLQQYGADKEIALVLKYAGQTQ
jgi:hypothetical protein